MDPRIALELSGGPAKIIFAARFQPQQREDLFWHVNCQVQTNTIQNGSQTSSRPLVLCSESKLPSSRTMRYKLRVLVDFLKHYRGQSKVYTDPAAKVCKCELARNYNVLSALCSFEQGITMVWTAANVSWCDLVRNYNGLNVLCSFE